VSFAARTYGFHSNVGEVKANALKCANSWIVRDIQIGADQQIFSIGGRVTGGMYYD